MKTCPKHTKSSWQNWVVGKLAKHLANYLKPQWLQCLVGSWQVGNCQLTLPTCQLSVSPYVYWVFPLILVGNTTPILKYRHSAVANAITLRMYSRMRTIKQLFLEVT
jgi:hypothetical protein